MVRFQSFCWLPDNLYISPADNTHQQRDDCQYDQDMDQSFCTVNENAQKPPDDQDNGQYIQYASHRLQFTITIKIYCRTVSLWKHPLFE